jgi:hypothetical protein
MDTEAETGLSRRTNFAVGLIVLAAATSAAVFAVQFFLFP